MSCTNYILVKTILCTLAICIAIVLAKDSNTQTHSINSNLDSFKTQIALGHSPWPQIHASESLEILQNWYDSLLPRYQKVEKRENTEVLQTHSGPYVFGINLALDSNLAGGFYSSQVDTLAGLEIWRDWWNALPVESRTTKWGEVVQVELYIETWSNYNLGFTPQAEQLLCDTYANMSRNSSIDFLFAPAAFMGVAVRKCSYFDQGVDIMVSHTDSSEFYYQIPGSFGSPTANILTMTSWLPYLRIARAKTIAVLRINDWVYQSEMCQGIVDKAADNGLEVVYYNDMPFDWWTLGQIEGVDNRSSVWSQELDKVIQLKPDAVAVCDYGYGVQFALKYLKSKNWIPKSFAATPLYLKFDDLSLLNYIITPAQFSRSAKYSPQVDFVNSAGYDNLVMNKYGRHASSVMAQATLAGMLYTNTLVNSNTNSTSDLIATMKVNQLQSFMGLSANDAFDRQTLLALVTQLMQEGDQVNIVGPATAAVNDFIYPMPTWDERTFKSKWGSWSEIVGSVLIGIGIIASCACFILLYLYREDKVIRVSSPLYCGLILIGSLIIYVSILTWMPSFISTSAVCRLRMWGLPLGVSLMFGSLLAKTHRINKLLNTRVTKAMFISNMVVAQWVAIMFLAQIAISMFMTFIPPWSESKIHTTDAFRPSKNYHICTFPKPAQTFFGVNCAYYFGMFVWGVYLSYKVRKVPLKSCDESKVIGFSLYNVAFFSTIVIVIQLVIGNSNRDLTFVITAACCFLGCMITIGCLFAAKLHAIRVQIYKSSVSTRIGSNSSNKSPSSRNRSNFSNSSQSNGEKSRYSDENESELNDLSKPPRKVVNIDDEIASAKQEAKMARKKLKRLVQMKQKQAEEEKETVVVNTEPN